MVDIQRVLQRCAESVKENLGDKGLVVFNFGR